MGGSTPSLPPPGTTAHVKPSVCVLAARASESQLMWSPSRGLPAGGSRCARTLRHLIATLIWRPHLSVADALSRASVWGSRNRSSPQPTPQKDRRSPKTRLLRLIVPMAAKKLPSAVAATSSTLQPPHPHPHPLIPPGIHSTVSTSLGSYRTSVPLCTTKKVSVKSADELRCICAFEISALKAWLSWRLRRCLTGHNREDNTHGYTR